jgi:hypothetical protein
MTLREALQQMDWQAFQMDGLAYFTDKALENSANKEVLSREATIEEYEDWGEVTSVIRVKRGGLTIEETSVMANEESSASLRSGRFFV